MAGESAAEVARRLREKAQRQLTAAEHWEKGAEGEQATALALEALPDTWTVLHDVRWPGRARANIDHVVVGPGGVFAVDSKNWSGQIEVRDNELRQDGRRRASAVSGAAEAALALTPIVARASGLSVLPVLCFVTEERLAAWANDVMVCSTANVTHMLSSRLTVLSPAQAQAVALAVEANLRHPAGEPSPRPGPKPAAPRRTTERTAAATPHPAAPRTVRAARPARATRPRRRRTRPGPVAYLVVAALFAGGFGLGPVRDNISDLVSGFIITTATDDDEATATERGTTEPRTTERRKTERRTTDDQPTKPGTRRLRTPE